ncbi:MAG TPA: hypothetical protein VNW04_11345 [Puia sp.]|jgi:hypothetical protein|nr:hypothetical protein [Puia sp.]
MAFEPGAVADAAFELRMDIHQDLHGVVTMDIGTAIGEEDGRDAVPQVEIGPEGADGGGIDDTLVETILYAWQI